ncbi:HlyD family efflux transporter periplasmic adaptor subunit [Novispirillum sp. DQ9]|uniref:HlyD family efflux transporter periplasmic adaptor subunit n=1 Tax=Novispirillum sp. DQ9 TaxID=3398612 RepID=UPI003C7A46E4
MNAPPPRGTPQKAPGSDAAVGSGPLLTLLQLEKEARHADSEAALRYVAVNRTRALVAYRQAGLLLRSLDGAWSVEAVSDVAVLERDAPFVRWLARLGRLLEGAVGTAAPAPVTAAVVAEEERANWLEFCAPHGLWLPLRHPSGMVLGALLLLRDRPFEENEGVLGERIADTYAHAWRAAAPGRWKRRIGRQRRRALMTAAAVAVLAVLAVPMHQSALAPGQVVPRDAAVVSAPLDGVVEAFHVRPNQQVTPGDPLFSFEAAMLRNALAVAEEELAVAEAELRTTTQGAFHDTDGRSKLALLRSRVDLKRAERDWAAERLSRVVVKADRAGLAVFHDVSDWIGRPVATGEKVLVIADPQSVELRLHLAVADAIALEPGAEVRLFLDVAPLEPLRATLVHAAYEPEMSDDQVLGYRVVARLDDGQAPPRIGLQGTAKIEGPLAPLAFHLFRRPLAAARQTLGL